MKDRILAERIETLRQNLSCADKDRDWLDKQLRQQSEMLEMELWPSEVVDDLYGGLTGTIGQQARNHIQELDDIELELMKATDEEEEAALKKAWQRFSKIYDESRGTFGEYLEFIGGLAIRYTGLDERVCRVADELIRSCSLEITREKWQSLTVPALQESFTKTLARIVRLRFPEWTIWTLPFTAHEYGHVVLEDRLELVKDPIKTFIEEEVESEAQEDEECKKARAANDAQGEERARQRIMKRLLVLLSDAFATYTMGPAYAYAMMYLRFNPLSARLADAERPPDVLRAHMVLSMLQAIDDEEEKKFTGIAKELETSWGDMLRRAGTDDLSKEEKQAVTEQAARIRYVYGRALFPTARYPLAGKDDEGWVVAEKWAGTWGKILRENQPLTGTVKEEQPGEGTQTDKIYVKKKSKLRDAINAAWLCRVKNKSEKIPSIALEARNLCEFIISLRRAPSNITPGQGRQPSSQHIPPARY